MPTSLIYRSAGLYETAMLALYRGQYRARHRAVAAFVPAGSTVLDLCCGPGTLRRYLPSGSVGYTGIDLNPRFVRRMQRQGVDARVMELGQGEQLPPADYVVMQASLYHFLPNAGPMVEQMVGAARRGFICAEPVRNLATSTNPVVSLLGRSFADPGNGPPQHRFSEAELDELFAPYQPRMLSSAFIAGEREKLYMIDCRDGA